MEFEDSRNALYVDPNAYIQRYNKKEQAIFIACSMLQENTASS